MSIPLDKLYHYLQDISGEDIIIYRWSPHGSKKLDDLIPLCPYGFFNMAELPTMIAHDQEPLDYDLYQSQPLPTTYSTYVNLVIATTEMPRMCSYALLPISIYQKLLLCHSEKNSPELEKFESHCIGVYYWSHAIIARDWFRYAKQDPLLSYSPETYTYDFLIYNRAWTGTREYRLKFAELLVTSNLNNNSLTSFSPTDHGAHYSTHKFTNADLTISNMSLEESLPENKFSPAASADYNAADYSSCGIEVVLETLFDDSRIHLTEKSLRPIACGKPFLLVSTPGALQYLRDYGFKTFSDLIDESYDNVTDSASRLQCIINEMNRISKLSRKEKCELFTELNNIALYNKELFFSDRWQQSIIDEFVTNFKAGITELTMHKNDDVFYQNLAQLIYQPELTSALSADDMHKITMLLATR